MPRIVSPAQYDHVIAVVRQFPEGAAPDDIAQLLRPQPPRRTLSRLLSTLIAEKRVVITGHGPSLRYFVAPGLADASGPTVVAVATGFQESKTSPRTGAVSAVAPGVATSSAAPNAAVSPGAPPAGLSKAETNRIIDDLIAASVAPVVTSVLPRVAAIPFLRNQAALYLRATLDQRIFVTCALSLLDDMTASEAIDHGVTAEQYALWRQYYPIVLDDDDDPGAEQAPAKAPASSPECATSPKPMAPAPAASVVPPSRPRRP